MLEFVRHDYRNVSHNELLLHLLSKPFNFEVNSTLHLNRCSTNHDGGCIQLSQLPALGCPCSLRAKHPDESRDVHGVAHKTLRRERIAHTASELHFSRLPIEARSVEYPEPGSLGL